MISVSRRRAWTTLGCSLAAFVVLAEPASASWQYTQWGMLPAEVKTASDATAVDNSDRRLDADGLKAELVAPFQGATLPFTAVFLFGIRDRLAVVTLNPRDRESCGQIPDILRAHYGPPLASEGLEKAKSARWNDYGNDNVVNFLDLGGGNCSIQYSRLLNTRNDGSL